MNGKRMSSNVSLSKETRIGQIEMNAEDQTNHIHKPPIKSFEEVVKQEESFIGRKLSPHELDSVKERVDYFKEHEGHESAHSEMLLIIIAGLIISQIIIAFWKKRHPSSYHNATLGGLWIIPMVVAVSHSYYKFIILWLLFSVALLYIISKSIAVPMDASTPRLVYAFFSRVYQTALICGSIGYFITLCAFFHLPMIFGMDIDGEANVFMTGIFIMFSGLYFGTLGRDFVERVSGIMATTMGYYAHQGFPRKHLREGVCAICGEKVTTRVKSHSHSFQNEDQMLEGEVGVHELGCGHVYHEQCIRGWTIVGKKEVCPYCKEKVDMSLFKKHAWDDTMRHFLTLVDFMRYIVVWNPIIFFLIHWVIEWLGLK